MVYLRSEAETKISVSEKPTPKPTPPKIPWDIILGLMIILGVTAGGAFIYSQVTR